MNESSRDIAARDAWDRQGVMYCQTMPEVIARSWQRCLRHGLDPCRGPVDAVISAQELRIAREASRELRAIARPELELLSGQIAGSNYMTALADADGVVLDAIMDTEFGASKWSESIQTGSIWREDMRGTNALGLALYSGETSTVTGREHFFTTHGDVSCVSVPIFGSNGQIVGLLDASSEVETRQHHTQALVNLAATNIENRLFMDAHGDDNIIQFHPRREYLATQSIGLLAFDDAGELTGCNRSATRLLSGLDLDHGLPFASVFEGGFHAAVKALRHGDTVMLRDRLHASCFARMRRADRRRNRGSGREPLSDTSSRLPALRDMRGPVLDDDLVRQSLRVIRSMMDLGHAVCIAGDRGTGKTTIAQTLHAMRGPDRYFDALDCRKLVHASAQESGSYTALARLTARLAEDSEGTLLLEHIDVLDQKCPPMLAMALEDLRFAVQSGAWSLLATLGANCTSQMQSVRLGPIRFHVVALPSLLERTDFSKLACAMLADLSPNHQIARSGIQALAALPMHENLWDLRHYLAILVATCPSGVLRDAQVQQMFPNEDAEEETKCSHCAGLPLKEKRCRDIRNMFSVCHQNVALTARRLGVSRNTVYKHIKGCSDPVSHHVED